MSSAAIEPEAKTENSFLKSQLLSFYVAACCSVIAMVSFYDIFLMYRWQGFFYEQNPICRYLISLEPEFMTVFALAKSAGTMICVVIISGLYRVRSHMGISVATAVLIFQIGLVLFLNFADYEI